LTKQKRDMYRIKRRALRHQQAEPVKAEPVKAEPVKAEPVKAEPVKAEPVKAEPVKAEPDQSVITSDSKSPPVRHNPLHNFGEIQLTGRSIRDNPLLRRNI
jgi:hypothetical protein